MNILKLNLIVIRYINIVDIANYVFNIDGRSLSLLVLYTKFNGDL